MNEREDEREAFEAWAESECHDTTRKSAPFTSSTDRSGSYSDYGTRVAWEAWNARASLKTGESK